jgi:6-oxo-cyclohex-1-ene-carbonyl-CoA hydrolase
MALDWLPRDNVQKDHNYLRDEWLGTMDKPPSTVYEKRPLLDLDGKVIKDLYSAWIIFNNPGQFNSYTTDMLKGAITGFIRSSFDKSVVATVFTAVGDRAFCTGGNTKEYSEFYTKRPRDYSDFVLLFAKLADAMLSCNNPVICRANGMRIAGGQELGMFTDVTIASDLGLFGQAGPRAGSAPIGGATDVLPWMMSMENAMWNCISCELWSAYKMHRLGLIYKVVPVKKQGDKWIPNPEVITDRYVENGQIVYGELKTGKEREEAKALSKSLPSDFTLLDKELNSMIYTLATKFDGCLMTSVNSIRMKKKYFWEYTKTIAPYWCANNMATEANLGFRAFATEKITGQRTIDHLELRRQVAAGHVFDDELAEIVFPKPLEKPIKKK